MWLPLGASTDFSTLRAALELGLALGAEALSLEGPGSAPGNAVVVPNGV